MSKLLRRIRIQHLFNTSSTVWPHSCYRICSGNSTTRHWQTYCNLGVGSYSTSLRFCSSKFHKYFKVMEVPEGVFRGKSDRFQGITVDSEEEFVAGNDFLPKLTKSLEHWSGSKRRAIWFQIHTKHSDWIPHLAKNGFEYHHAIKGMVVMCRWLPEDEYNNLPVYAHTMVGVGGLVVNDRREVLVVSEKHALIPNSWKLPGGYVEPRENLVDAVIREVREETGVECEFNTVICLRHSHGGGFGCSDLYMVCALKPKNTDLVRCEREIAKVQWMPIEEYLSHPNVHETNRHFVRTLLDYEKRGVRFTCEKQRHQILKKEYCIYYMRALEGEGVSDKKQ